MDSKTVENAQLLAELKLIFPEIPEQTVQACVIQHAPNKEICIKVLSKISKDYACNSPSQLSTLEELSILDDLPEIINYKFENKLVNAKDAHASILKELDNLRFAQLEEKHSSIKTELYPITTETISKNNLACENRNIVSSPVTSTSILFSSIKNSNDLHPPDYQDLFPHSDISNVTELQYNLNPNEMNWSSNQDVNQQSQFSPHSAFLRGFSCPAAESTASVLKNISLVKFPQNNVSAYCSSGTNIQDYNSPLHINVTSVPEFSNPGMFVSSSNIFTTAPDHCSLDFPHLSPCFSPISSPSTILHPSSPKLHRLSSPIHHSPSNNIPIPISMSQYIYSNHQETENTINWINPPKFQQQYELFPKQEFLPTNFVINVENNRSDVNIHISAESTPFLPQTSVSESKDRSNEAAYIKALLLHQKARYDMIRKELSNMKHYCYTLKKDVSFMEQRSQQHKIPNMEEIQKLREENRKLSVDCNCMTMEVDLLDSGKAPLGETDDNFYRNIFTGPSGPILPVNNTEIRNLTQNKYQEEEDSQVNKWNCSKCTYANHPALEHCEMCEMPRVMLGV